MKFIQGIRSAVPGMVFFALGLGLRAILSRAPSPEASQSLIFAIPAFFVFLAWVLALLTFGAWIRSRFKVQLPTIVEKSLFDLSVGSLGAYLAAYLLTPLGAFASESGVVLWGLLSFSFHLGFRHLSWREWAQLEPTRLGKFFLFLMFLVVGIKLIEGLQFHQHGDAYVTYLVGPRIWAADGGFDGFRRYSQLFLSTSWESLFAWGTALMGFRGGAGLDISQWFSQWVTAGVGMFGALLGVFAMGRRLNQWMPIEAFCLPVLSLVALQVPALRWTQNLAKNDIGVAFWCLSAFYFCQVGEGVTAGVVLIAGALTGAAVVGKLAIGFYGIGLFFWILIFSQKRIFAFVAGGLIGALPVFVRNFWMTRNPVFPWLPKLFPSPLLNAFSEHGASAATLKLFHFADLPLYLAELRDEAPWLILLPIALWVFKKRREWAGYIAFPTFSFIAFTLTFRPSTGVRYLGAVLILFAFISLQSAFALMGVVLARFGRRIFWAASAILAFAVLAGSSLTFFTLFQIGNPKKFSSFSKAMLDRNQIGGPAKVWIRNHIRPEEKILSYGDVHIYYLIDYALTEVGQDVEYGSKVFGKSLDEAEKVLRSAPFDYLYLAGDDYYKDEAFENDRTQINQLLIRTSGWNQSCKLYGTPEAQVWNLKCLKPI